MACSVVLPKRSRLPAGAEAFLAAGTVPELQYSACEAGTVMPDRMEEVAAPYRVMDVGAAVGVGRGVGEGPTSGVGSCALRDCCRGFASHKS